MALTIILLGLGQIPSCFVEMPHTTPRLWLFLGCKLSATSGTAVTAITDAVTVAVAVQRCPWLYKKQQTRLPTAGSLTSSSLAFRFLDIYYLLRHLSPVAGPEIVETPVRKLQCEACK